MCRAIFDTRCAPRGFSVFFFITLQFIITSRASCFSILLLLRFFWRHPLCNFGAAAHVRCFIPSFPPFRKALAARTSSCRSYHLLARFMLIGVRVIVFIRRTQEHFSVGVDCKA